MVVHYQYKTPVKYLFSYSLPQLAMGSQPSKPAQPTVQEPLDEKLSATQKLANDFEHLHVESKPLSVDGSLTLASIKTWEQKESKARSLTSLAIVSQIHTVYASRIQSSLSRVSSSPKQR